MSSWSTSWEISWLNSWGSVVSGPLNANATRLSPKNYEQDPKSGFLQYPGTMIRDGQSGDYTRRRSYDPRHPQELLRSRGGDKQTGSVAPEQPNRFVGTDIDTVEASDL